MPSGKVSRAASRLLSALGMAIVLYSLFVLEYAVTAYDLGIRCLLVSEGEESGGAESAGRFFLGPRIEKVLPTLRGAGELPEAGDRLLAIAREPVATFNDFARQLANLRGTELPPGGMQKPNTDLVKERDRLPPVVLLDNSRWVEVEYFRPRDGRRHQAWVQLQPLPPQELVPSFVWFILEFGIFMVGALVFWTRPDDRQARLFYAMCVVTMGGFVGGYHWWLIAGNPWLTVPFTVCAMLLPVVTLHFFLVYPEPVARFWRRHGMAIFSLYGLPGIYIVCVLACMGYGWWLQASGAPPAIALATLQQLTLAITGYFFIAAAYFLTTLVALLYNFLRPHHPLVHNQVKWILGAGLVATLPVGYTLYLSMFHEVEFALGRASIPMFTASLLFMLAYAVGIVRYKLMLVDQILSRGMLYYVISFLLTLTYSAAIAGSSLVGLYQTTQISQRAIWVMGTVVVMVLLMGWFRDRLQHMIDRRFFREKYQLDKALMRINQPVGQVVAPEVLAERMLNSCRDVLAVEQVGLYVRESGHYVFRLLAAQGASRLPVQFPFDEAFLEEAHSEPTHPRTPDERLERVGRVQTLLHDFNMEMLHVLEVEGEIAGIVLLGAKRGGVLFTAEDLTFLTTLGQLTGVALHSARVHQKVVRLNEESRLQREQIDEQQRALEILQGDRLADQQQIGEQRKMISLLQAEITARRVVSLPPPVDSFRRDLLKGSSPAMIRVLDTVRKVSGSQSSVLIRGESGTGKELLARTLHDNGPRREGPLVSVHCGALSPGLLESELFGHVKGAFTGAHRDRPGRFELAQGGTLFLDEIGDISLDTQIKLLRVLQERQFEPVGDSRTVEVDVRLIAATHQPLERLIAQGKFREDLFYRLNVISITLPPLRERGDDILELALHFLGRAADRTGKGVTHFDHDALRALRQYPWPGNIRELENAIERAVVLAERSSVALSDLPPQVGQFETPASATPRGLDRVRPQLVVPAQEEMPPEEPVLEAAGGAELSGTGEMDERELLLDALRRSRGNKAEAARLLGLPRSTFFSKLKKHALA